MGARAGADEPRARPRPRRAGPDRRGRAAAPFAAATAPTLSETQLALVEALINLGRTSEARERLDALTAAEPHVARYWLYLGELLRVVGDHSGAIDALGQGLRHHPKEAALYERLALVLRTIGRIDDASAAFELAASLDPASTFAQAGLVATQSASAAA